MEARLNPMLDACDRPQQRYALQAERTLQVASSQHSSRRGPPLRSKLRTLGSILNRASLTQAYKGKCRTVNMQAGKI